MSEFEAVLIKQREYFKSGATQSVAFRKEQLLKLKQLLQENETVILEALSQDLGKASMESYFSELGVLYHSLSFTIKKLNNWQKPKRVKTPLFLWPAKSFTQPEPYGTTLIMSAFNYPLLLSLDPLVGAISGGNVAMVALSEATPTLNRCLIELSERYFSQDYLYLYEGNKEKNTEVLKSRFDKIFFTGSPKVGKIVMNAASQHLTPVTLELGGKSPALVTDKAKLNHAAESLIWGKFLNTGQTCVAPDYCLVAKELESDFLKAVTHCLTEFYGTDPKESLSYGRLVSEQTVNRLAALLERDKSYIYVGGQVDTQNKFISPTLISASLGTDLAVMEEELFGPILPILSYTSLEEAVSFIEAGEKPLAFYPFTEDKREAKQLISRLSFGGSTINDTVLHLANPNLPFGGVGHSGMGSYHGYASFECFTHKKSILKRSSLFRLPLMNPPYTSQKEKWIRRFLK